MSKPVTIEPLTREKFHEFLTSLQVPAHFDETFLYRLHTESISGLQGFLLEQPNNPIRYINPLLLTVYVLHEHAYFAAPSNDELSIAQTKDDSYMARIISAAIDKYLTNEHLEYKQGLVKSRYYPPLTTLKMYTNTINGLLGGFHSKEPQRTLLTDIAKKCFSLVACAIDLLISGFETEAFSTWRTLHESEAILLVLHQHPQEAIPAYLRHLQYALAFHHLVEDKEHNDAIFATIKEQMRQHDLKSKDMKKFIEYGWMFAVKDAMDIRLNFRDGVQRLAGLTRYQKAYEMSSEITHSSPLLIYSRRTTFYDITLIYLYETFFRLEQVFNKLFTPWLNRDAQNRYVALRNIYYPHLTRFHRDESEKLTKRKTAK